MRDQLFNILDQLIIKSNIRINRSELKLQLSSHPSYPSLHALTGVLEHFDIPNAALRLPVNKEILDQLPRHFIANVDTDRGGDLVLIEKKGTKIKLKLDTDKNKIISQEAFLNQWKGIIVVIEKDDLMEEVPSQGMAVFFNWLLVFCGVLWTANIVFSLSDPFAQIHFLLSLIGLVFSIQIVKHELGISSMVANNFCNLSENTSCDAVLNAKGATLFGWLKLSDISLVIFVAYSCFWLLSFISGNTNALLISAMTAFAFPFVLYSIYYQYRVVKKWCPLCLGIGFVLILQFSSLLLYDFSPAKIHLDMQSIGLLAWSLLSSAAIWSLLKPVLKRKEALGKLELAHHKFKRDFSLFNALYAKGSSLSSTAPIAREIVLGNRNAPIEIILVTSPFCYFCKAAHRDIDKILRKAKDKVKVIIRFVVDVKNKDTDLYKITSKLIEIYNLKGDTACLHALEEVYGAEVDYKKWLQKYNQRSYEKYESTLEQQHKWTQANGINFTPAFYLNRKAYPKEYDRIDLLYFIEEFIELQLKMDAKLAAS